MLCECCFPLGALSDYAYSIELMSLCVTIGPLMGNVSQNCAEACSAFNMICNPSMALDNPMETYTKEGWPCSDDTSNPLYGEPYHPSYDKSTRKCEGFRNLPSLINCTHPPPNDGKTTRLCNCVTLCMYPFIFVVYFDGSLYYELIIKLVINQFLR